MIRRVFILFTVLCFQAGFYAQKTSSEIVLKFKENYCGGARPSEEMEAEFTKEKAYANMKMILVKGKKADTLTTDKNGVLKLRLRKGNYLLMEPWRYYKKGANGLELSYFNLKCMEPEWAKATVRINIQKRKAVVEYLNEIIRVCDWQLPCIQEGKQVPIPD